MATIIIGNGETRKDFDLTLLDNHNTFGCNGICRDFDVDVIVACDRQMAEEAADTGRTVYTRQDWKTSFGMFPNIKYFPDLPYTSELKQDKPFHWGSGPYAAYLACLSDATELYFIGFDLFSPNGFHNNIYKGSVHYESADYRAVDPSFWIHQLQKLFNIYKNKTFTFVYPEDWKTPSVWTSDNIRFINYKNFQNLLDNA